MEPVSERCPTGSVGNTTAVPSGELVDARRFLMGITTNNSADLLSLMAPDVVYTVPGRGPLAGVYHGPSEVHDHIRRLFSLTPGLSRF
jgi:ketosteroid isomerase-like protein